MSLIKSIKQRLGLSNERETAIGHMPTPVRENALSKFKLRKEVNAQGQIYLPAEVRRFDKRPDISRGDKFSLDIFAPEYSGIFDRDCYERYVDVSVISGHRVTIPAEVRHELDIREGDTIAVHAYWESNNSEE